MSAFSNHDPTLITILEIIGSYFVDVFYNHIYNSAKLRQGGRSITDEYKKQIQTYILAVKNDSNLYRNMVTNMHKYFQNVTSYTTITFNNFVDKIVEQFVPEEYLDLYKTEERDEILGNILCDLVSGLGTHATSPEMLSKIIDQHGINSKVIVRMMQDHSITLMLTKRDSIHNRLLGEQTQAKEVVSMSIVNNLTEKIHSLAQDKAKLLAKVGRLQQKLDDSYDREAVLEDNIAKLTKKLKSLLTIPKEKKASKKESTKPEKSAKTDKTDKTAKTAKTAKTDKTDKRQVQINDMFQAMKGKAPRKDNLPVADVFAEKPKKKVILNPELLRRQQEEDDYPYESEPEYESSEIYEENNNMNDEAPSA